MNKIFSVQSVFLIFLRGLFSSCPIVDVDEKYSALDMPKVTEIADEINEIFCIVLNTLIP